MNSYRSIKPTTVLAGLFVGTTGAVGIVVAYFLVPRPAELALLSSPEPEDRKRTAWAIAEGGEARGAEALRERLESGIEADPDVREAYLYSLGLLSRPQDFELSLRIAQDDPSGYVRQAAWLALARIDPQRCRLTLEQPWSPGRISAQTRADAHRSQDPGAHSGGARRGQFEVDRDAELEADRSAQLEDDRWNRLGRAQAWLWLGDLRGLDELFESARAGEHDQRVVAARVILRHIQPALSAAGRWPVNGEAPADRPLPPALVNRIEERCRELDLQQVIAELHITEQRAAPVRRNKARLTGARERIARLLLK